MKIKIGQNIFIIHMGKQSSFGIEENQINCVYFLFFRDGSELTVGPKQMNKALQYSPTPG